MSKEDTVLVPSFFSVCGEFYQIRVVILLDSHYSQELEIFVHQSPLLD